MDCVQNLAQFFEILPLDDTTNGNKQGTSKTLLMSNSCTNSLLPQTTPQNSCSLNASDSVPKLVNSATQQQQVMGLKDITKVSFRL